MKTANSRFLTRIAAAGLFLAMQPAAWAQNTETLGILPRVHETVATSSFGIGYKGALDTYLSNAAYSGVSFQFSQLKTSSVYELKYFSFHDSRSSMSFSAMTNQRGNGSMIGGEWSDIFTWEHMLLHTQSVDLLAGPSAVSSMGILYNERNSNNPAQFKFLLSAAVSGKAIYRFSLLRRHMALTADLSVPVLGTTFAPDYGEPYFILATYQGLGSAFRIATPFNAPALFSDLTLTIPAGRNNRLSLTYEANYTGYTIAGQKSAIANQVFMAGFTRRLELKKD